MSKTLSFPSPRSVLAAAGATVAGVLVILGSRTISAQDKYTSEGNSHYWRLQPFAVARRSKVTFASLFCELLRLGHNGLVSAPRQSFPYSCRPSSNWRSIFRTAKAFGLTIPQALACRRRQGDRIQRNLLHCICPLLMLWTAPPPARKCHGCGCC